MKVKCGSFGHRGPWARLVKGKDVRLVPISSLLGVKALIRECRAVAPVGGFARDDLVCEVGDTV